MTPLRSFRESWESLHEDAAKASGYADFGDTSYHEGMRVLLAALDDGATLNDAERASARRLITGALAGRAITQVGWAGHPRFAERPVLRPLIVIGLPRTGTTALHQLLSLDTQFQVFEHWLAPNPIVRPARARWDDHRYYQASASALQHMRAVAPEIMAAHSADVGEADECLVPMSHSFCSQWFCSNLDIPTYDSWFRSQDETASFTRYRAVLQLVGLDDPRPWLLKNPSHLFGIHALLDVFPDARIIQTHRHPAEAIASLTSLLGGIRDLQAARPIDRDRLQQREIGFWSEAARRGMDAQDKHPERFVNVYQRAIRSDPLGVVDAIYHQFKMTLSDDARSRMLHWAAQHPPKAGSGHHYAAIADQTLIAEHFGDYIARYRLGSTCSEDVSVREAVLF